VTGTRRTRCARVMSRADGLLHYVYEPGAVVTLKDSEEIVAALAELSDEPRPTLVEMQRVHRIEPECRRFYEQSRENASAESSIALVVGTPVSRVIATAFLGLNRPDFAIALFDTVPEAEAWLHRSGRATLASSVSSS